MRQAQLLVVRVQARCKCLGNHSAALLESVGFQRGLGTPVIFHHPERDVSCAAHGDDFTFEGKDGDLTWIQVLLESWFDIKVRARLGPEQDDDKEVSILGRVVRWRSWGISSEADPKHRRMIAEYFGLDGKSKIRTVNGPRRIRSQLRTPS